MRQARSWIGAIAALALAAPGAAAHGPAAPPASWAQHGGLPLLASGGGEDRSPNVSPAAEVPLPTSSGDIAFWEDRAAVSTGYSTGDPAREGFHLLDISNARKPRLLSSFYCPGAGYDVGIWGSLVFLSVNEEAPESCTGGADGKKFAGIRIVSIADPARPVQIATVATCGGSGSHTHTIVPDLDNGRLLLYVSAGCVDVVEVKLAQPAAARVVYRVQETLCHDITVHLERRLAAAACTQGAQLWDIAEPGKPRVLSHFVSPHAENHHSALFSADGRALALGDENLHLLALGRCLTGTPYPQAGLSFFDVGNAEIPRYLSHFQAEHKAAPRYCSAHQFSLVPRRDERDVLTAGWYGAGTVLVDFTDPARPRQLGHYLAEPDGGARASMVWSGYFYRGHVWATNTRMIAEGIDVLESRRGLDVLDVDDPAFHGAVRLHHLNAQTQEPGG